MIRLPFDRAVLDLLPAFRVRVLEFHRRRRPWEILSAELHASADRPERMDGEARQVACVSTLPVVRREVGGTEHVIR